MAWSIDRCPTCGQGCRSRSRIVRSSRSIVELEISCTDGTRPDLQEVNIVLDGQSMLQL